MRYPDRIPPTLSNKPFPLGDVNDVRYTKRVNDWFEKAEQFNYDKFMNRTQLLFAPAQVVTPTAVHRSHSAAVKLARQWDTARGMNNDVFWGYAVTMAFNNETHYLPKYTVDFTDQTEQMAQAEEQLHRARTFGQTAWRSMAQYPNVYATFTRLLKYSAKHIELGSPPDSIEYFQAGMALPFMFALTSKLVDDTPEFTSFTNHDNFGRKMNLRTTPFSRFFTK